MNTGRNKRFAGRVLSLSFVLILVLLVQSFAAYCDSGSSIYTSESKCTQTHGEFAGHACCMNTAQSHQDTSCEERSNCNACVSQQSSSRGNTEISRYMEHIGEYYTPILFHDYVSNVYTLNNKHINFELTLQFQLPPSTPVLLI
ncbi:hypothetical protein QA601_02110 [Chitinispirillales bacterium ANBcel5]|uniref:hypothetical protein n=1 Tax=Cellulosispirillum alkaliphilum TaxID=3039283 RepID=UPI002A54C021|nr:hypothetical protein [Chitinispirillales bacterium ANBcel5]